MSIFSQGDALLFKWTHAKHLKSVVFFVAFIEATFSPLLPEAFVLLILAYRKDVSWKVLSFISAAGSACGSLVMYLLGMMLFNAYGELVLKKLHAEAFAENTRILFTDNAFLAQFIAAATPFPDKLFSFLAGAFLISPFIIFIATFLGRFVRIVPVAFLSYKYGDQARLYVKNNGKKVSISVGLVGAFYIFYKMLF